MPNCFSRGDTFIALHRMGLFHSTVYNYEMKPAGLT